LIYFTSLLSYGDNLISLSLLAQLKDKKNITIVGTNLTRAIADFIPQLDIPIAVVFKNIPAFYDIRKQGSISALKDWIGFLSKVVRCMNKEDALVFEKSDFRSRLLAGSFSRMIYKPDQKHNVYVDRRNLLQAVWGQRVKLKDAVRLHGMPRCVIINPASRLKEKAISGRILSYLISYLEMNHINIQLIDPDHEHSNFKHLVDSYHTGMSLEQTVERVRDCDLYIGADSLLIHFSYQFEVPFLVLFNKTNLYFAPPGTENQRNYIEFVSHLSEKEFFHALDSWFSSILRQ